MKHWKAVGLLLLAALSLGGAEVDIPKISREAGERIAGKMRFEDADWRGAATVNRLSAVGGAALQQKTVFHLQHDGVNLYAGVIAADSSGRAFPRGVAEDLTNDEGVQVTLGLGARFASRLNMGGYENAFSEQAAVAHFYEFTVNKAGAVSRSYNETILPEPRFTAKVEVTPKEYRTVMVIPFAALGLEPAAGELTLAFNLFRFYNNVRYGWHLPGFYGYASYPFGRARLLTAGSATPATAAGPWQPPKAPGATATEPARCDLTKLELRYYPLLRMVGCVVPADRSGRKLVLRSDTMGTVAELVLNSDRPNALKLALPPELSAGTKVNTELLRDDGGGRLVSLAHLDFTVAAAPPWQGTRAGIEYLDRVVPRPWTPPAWRDGSVLLAHAGLLYNDRPLPERITVLGQEILDAPMQIVAVAGGRELAINPLVRAEARPTCVDLASAAAPGIEWKSRVDFDGFTIVRLRLRDVAAKELEKLELRIPLAKGLARYFIPSNVQLAVPVGTWGFSTDSASQEFWFGNVNGGLNFSFDRSPFYSPEDGRQIELVNIPGKKSELIIRLVTAAGQVEGDDTVFQFFLQPTPLRPTPVKSYRDRTDLLFEEWSDFQSYPDQSKIPMIRERAAAAHAGGKKFFLYFGQVVAENAPYFRDFPDELYAPNRSMYYERAYEPGKGVRCYLSCLRGPGLDLLLDGVEKIADATGLDALYFDGPSVPFQCENPLHECDDRLSVRWDDSFDHGRVPGQRAFMKRVRGIFDARGHDDMIWAHTGGSFHLATLGLSDFFYEGEQLARYRRGYLLDPERFAIAYSGKAFGFRGLFLPTLYIDSTLTTKQALPWALIHDTENPIGSHPVESAFYRLVTTRDPGAKFYGYWQDQPHLVNRNPEVSVSYYRGSREAFVAASNLRYVGTQRTRLELGGIFPGEALQVTPLFTGAGFEFDGTGLSFEVPEKAMRLFHVAPAAVDVKALGLPDPAQKTFAMPVVGNYPTRRSFGAGDWELSGSPVAAKATERGAVTLACADNSFARAVFADYLPKEFCFEFKLIHSGEFYLEFDKMVIRHDAAGGWLIEGLNEFSYGEECDVTIANYGRTYGKPDTEVVVRVAVRDGRLTILYDGVKILAGGYPQETAESHRVALRVHAGNRLVAEPLMVTAEEVGRYIPVEIHPVR